MKPIVIVRTYDCGVSAVCCLHVAEQYLIRVITTHCLCHKFYVNSIRDRGERSIIALEVMVLILREDTRYNIIHIS